MTTDLQYRGIEVPHSVSILNNGTEAEFLAWCGGVDAVMDAPLAKRVGLNPAEFPDPFKAPEYRHFVRYFNDGEPLALYRVSATAGDLAVAYRREADKDWAPSQDGNPGTLLELVLRRAYHEISENEAQAIEDKWGTGQ